jgi:osmotically-inducible protein OsmY
LEQPCPADVVGGVPATDIGVIVFNDDKLQKDVLAELKWEPLVSAAHIGVTAKNGVVTLSGHVDNYMSKHAAERAASRVQGVNGVAEEIKVELPYESKRSDDEIAAAVLDRLAWNVMLPCDAIKVKVEAAYVTLTGEVEWHYQKEAATHDAQRLHGVIGVTNTVKIKDRVDTAGISEDIKLALKRSWYTRPDSISVAAEGGKVKLTGAVHSPHARYVAGESAWNAVGTTAVENDLVIT